MKALEMLDEPLLQGIARLVHDGVRREYPYQPAHVLMSPSDLRVPKDMHPAFYGCFDWHSAVHSHWTMLKLLELDVDLPERGGLCDTLDAHLSLHALQVETAYFLEPGRSAYERPYGWAWVWKLTADLASSPVRGAAGWHANIRPLADLLADRFAAWLSRQVYPCRTGTHANTAFAITFGLEYSRACQRPGFGAVLQEAATRFYGADCSTSFRMEPSGNDFMSPLLAEIDLMGRVLPADMWISWLGHLLVGIGELGALRPAAVTDRADGQGVHLDGLNLSRAWHLALVSRRLADAGPELGSAQAAISHASRMHWEAGVQHLFTGDFLGEHWLGTFALLAAQELPPLSLDIPQRAGG